MKHDWLLFAVGVIRVAAFAVGAYYGWKHKHALMFSGFGMASVSGAIYAFSNAGFDVDRWMVQSAAYWSTPIAILIVAAAIFNDELDRAANGKPRRWRP